MLLREYIEERQAVHLRRIAGEPGPWTEDPVLKTKKFCCAVRDDDRTSVEAKSRILALPEEEHLPAAMTFRLYNRISTLDALAEAGVFRLRGIGLGEKILPVLQALPMVFNTSAYRVTMKGGLWSLPGVSTAIGKAIRAARDGWQPRKTAELTAASLAGTLDAGPFLCYQILQDLRWLGHQYEDERSWCMLGPGAVRGLERAAGTYDTAAAEKNRSLPSNKGRLSGSTEDPVRVFARHRATLAELLEQMPPYINMFELEHNLCEWDKHERIRTGEAKGMPWRPVRSPAPSGTQPQAQTASPGACASGSTSNAARRS